MTRAVLFANGVETAYSRAGSGPTVIMLGGSLIDGTQGITQLGPLIARCRVFVPEQAPPLPGTPEPGSDHVQRAIWLHDFIEGLGLSQVSVVARPNDAPVLEQLMQRFPDDVQRVLYVPENPTVSNWLQVAHRMAGESLTTEPAAG